MPVENLNYSTVWQTGWFQFCHYQLPIYHYHLHMAYNDWLIIYCFTSRSRIFHLCGDVTITGEGLQNLDLCTALRALEQGGIFIVPHLLWHGASVFPVSSKGLPHSVASYDTQGDVEDLSNPDPHGSIWRIYHSIDSICKGLLYIRSIFKSDRQVGNTGISTVSFYVSVSQVLWPLQWSNS
jgi:hypothetical protein